MSRVANFWLVIFLLCCMTRPALAQCVVQANFGYTGTCQGLAAHFSDSTTFNSGNSITSWLWNFGDGNTSALTNPNHTYASTGNFVVTLTVTTSQGCSDSEVKNITVGVPPVAAFVINNNPVTCNQEFITYTNNSTGNGLTFLWNFDNGTTSTLQNPQQFITAMPISCINHLDNTILHVSDVLGCTSTVSHSTLVQSRPSAELISASEHICAVFVNGAYEAEHTLFNMSFSGCLQSYIIDWGDGTPPENESTDSMSYSHVYHNYGYFPVVVYGVGNGGACQTVVFRDTVLIEITPTAGIIGPTASFTNGCAPFHTYFILNSTVTPTTTQTVIWGGTDTVTLPNTYVQGDTVWHTFTKSGCDSLGVMTPFNIVLTAENLCGSSFTTWGNYTVHRPPIARFNIPDTICKNDLVSFQNTTMRNLCGGWAFTQFNWRIFKNGLLVVNSNALTPDAVPTLPNLNYAFVDTGTYVIILTATDGGGFGCGSTQFSKTVFVQGSYANFWSDTVCLGNTTMFFDSSYSVNGILTAWHWDFGDGTQSTDTNALHIFSSAGFQNVTLITFDSNNCSDTITKQAYVSPYPVANFNADTVCIGSTTTFTDSSYTTAIDSIISWTWDFGDGDSSFVQNPVHTYAADGFYNVTLIVSTTYSCPDTILKAVYVSPFPTASFTSDSVCLGDPTTFTDLSTTAASDSLVFWSWDFGDNTVSNDTNPTHTFLTDGFHDVTLIAGSSIGCYDTIVNQVYVSPIPTAYFIFDTVCLGYPVHFIDSSYTDSITTVTGWTWSFGDNDTSDVQSPNHLYTDTGYFNVTLIISTSLGCIDSITQSIYVNPYPIVDFTSTQVCIGDTTQFTDITTTSPIDHIISWDWDFGGGATSNLQNPTFVFATAGYHSVTLNTESAVGCFESVTHNAYVSPFPVANFNAPPTCIGNATVYNNQSSTTGIHPINQWYWTLGDGTTAVTQSPVHTYGDTGVYAVSLAVKTTLGCKSDTVYKNTYVSPYPVAAFTFDTVCLTHLTHFTDVSHTIANDSIISWQWAFGDGNVANLQNPQHMYADSGVYNVTLIIASSIGCTDTITSAVYVKPMPIPGFTASTVCFGNNTVFGDTSVHSAVDAINSWTWHFGDGNVSAQQHPNHLYPDSGMYNVTLIISTDIGCADSITKNVYVSPYPTALFTVDSVCAGNGSSFTEASITPAQDSIVSWQWDFGDGNQSNDQNPSYTYADTGHFIVSLVVTTSISCTDTLVQTTYISPYPVAGFTADTACFGNATIFTDTSSTTSIDSITTWAWTFGDGNSSTQQSPTHLYADTGFYNVTLIVTSYYGCADTVQKNIYVKPLPTPNFSATTSCFGFATVFSDSSYSSVVDTINSWVWHLGDGTTSNLQSPSHIYSDSGLYQVTLIVSSAIGCSDSITQAVYVSPPPVAVFKSDTVCIGNATNFTDSSYTLANDSITVWDWIFGDGGTSALQNPAHTYADTGHFSVTLVITTSIGCTDTTSRIVYVSPYPEAGFMADTACLGFPTSFTDTSGTAAIDNIALWNWDFGDGNSSNLQNPQHVYADSGNFIVTLIVGSAIGCNDTVFQSIYVNAPPAAGFTNTTECLGHATLFTDTSTVSVYDNITDWVWNFGDSISSTLQNPSHTYTDSGYYSVSLIVNSRLGCSDTSTVNVYVSPYPVAAFNSDTVCVGNMTSFTDLSYTPANDSITDWEWDFGDGNSSILQNPTHTYADTGYFDVSLIVSSSMGCSDTLTQHAYVSAYPVAAFSADTSCLTWPTSFTDLSHTPAIDSIISLQWDFGDGQTSNLQHPQHIYADSGFYVVSLVVTSTFGCSDTTSDSIYVKPLPVPDFTAPSVCLGNVTSYADSSYSSLIDTVSLWDWHFGDGNTSNVQNPVHLFADTGLYATTLIVSSSIGCTDSITRNVYVSPFPVADFTADTVCMGYPTNFTDVSVLLNSDSITDWLWDFGDGNTSTLQHTQHVYGDSGFYNVTLIISTSIGCSDTVSRNVYVSPSPIANFGANTVCLNNPTVFNDSSFTLAIDTIQTWLWDFGDGNSSNLQNPQHTYSDTGIYAVSLTIESTIGCPNTIIKNIYVSAYPKAEFSADTVCFYLPTSFADLSFTLAADSINSWDWQFSDGNTSNTQNSTHIFADTGHFNVQLLITSYIGCADSITHSVYVSPYPVADFTADTACIGDTTHFTDISYTDAIDHIAGWNWDFGDGSTSGQQHPVHLYSSSGIYNVTLIINSEIGCADTIVKNVYVSPLPMAQFTADTVCIGATTTFNDLSNTTAVDSVTTWAWDFGDGQVSAFQNTVNLYTDTGLFTVSLAVMTSLGCTDTVTQDVYVSPLPHAYFTADTACIGNITSYTDSSFTPAQDVISNWQWQFGDGSTSNIQNSTHTYPNTGSYNVTLTVVSGIGCQDSITQLIYISPYPNADFTADTACLGGATTFTNLSGTNAIDSLTVWEWDFGDGNTSALLNPSHAYSTSGVFQITLIVGSSIGCTDTISKDVYVSPPPAVLFSADSVCLGFSTAFTDLTTVDFPDSILSWAWSFGDGDTSALQHPLHLYADSGIYAASLTINTLLGCSNSDTVNVYVKPLPVARFEALPVCLGNATIFNDSSTTAINDSLFSWYWDFGDGSTSNIQNPSHQYADTGTYNVMLVVAGYNGCTDTVTGDIHVIPLPIAAFSVTPVCFGDTISCTDLTDSLGYDITGWQWDFGDGNTSAQQQASHNYQAPGNYLITLTVYNAYNCSDTTSHTVQIYDIPVPDFGFNDVCLNENTMFEDSSVVVTNAIINWQWAFDDGDSSTAQNPAHLYANFGTYNVSLTVTDSVGCTDSITKPVTVYPLPVAAFTADSICTGDTAYFNDISTTSSGNISTWQWDFGDASGVSASQNPAYLYDTVLNMTDYNVSLIVSNSYGCLDTLNQNFHINPLPVVQFNADTACFGNATAFADLSYSNGGTINSWQWNFGDGIGNDTVSNPSYLYGNIGFYNAVLSVSDVKGCSQSTTQLVLVDSLPIPSFTWCQVCLSGTLLPVTFVNTSQGNGSTIASNFWTFGNGQTSSLNDSVTTNYQTAGNYNVTLVNTNDRGCSDSITQTINVHSGLAVDFTYDVSCFDISFNATSNNATSLIEWQWDFGDGNYSNQHDSAQHTYFQPGTYQITLTVYDSLPCLNIVCQQSVSHYIYVYPAPIADFSATNVMVGLSTVFTDLSTAPQSSVVSWAWDFGDGTTSTLQNPSHAYLQYGVYDVTLTIENSYGCSQTITQQVIVYPALVAEFDSATVCAQTPLTFNNTSQVLLSGVTVSWLWDFDDGQTSTDSLPTHTFNLPGVYNVMLIVSMSPAVADTTIHQITVIEAPVADFNFTEVCLGDTLTSFYDNTYSVQPLVLWRWDLGDSTISTQPNVNHLYTQYGTYNVQLVVQNTYGCTDSINKIVRVFDMPFVDFDASPKSGCLPLTVAFNDLSTVNDATLINWVWEFGDSLTDVGAPLINHTYNHDNMYSVSLTVTTDKGCENTFTIPNYIQVFPVPDADFTYSPTVPFSTDLVQFNNISTGCNAWLWDFGDGDNSIIYNPHHVFDEGFFTTTLVVYNQYNCTDTAYREIFVRPVSTIYAPNSFTPLNQDGLNDIFMVKGTNLSNFEMRIFNRYGQQIFYSDDVNKGWDGKFKGHVVPIGTYVWKVWYTDSFSYKQEVYGTVSVVY